MSASEPGHGETSAGGDEPELEDEWIAVLTAPTAAARQHRARELATRAARSSAGLDELLSGLVAGAQRWWSRNHHGGTGTDVHAAAAVLFDRMHATADTAVTAYQRQAEEQLYTRDKDRADFVNDLLAGRTDPGRLAQRAQRYGIRIAGPHTVTIAQAVGLTQSTVGGIDHALAARFGAGNTLTALYGNHLVCISTGGLRGLPAELGHHLMARFEGGVWQVGVGRTHQGAAGIATSLEEARSALDLAQRLGFTTPIVQAADLLVFPVLLRDREAITDLVDTVLGPLRTARGGPQTYLETLSVLFDHQGNYTATARAMHLSVRAITYRLDRIQALTGYHPSDPTQRFTLHAAVLGAKLLDWPDNDVHGEHC